jgi:hypothetical protein
MSNYSKIVLKNSGVAGSLPQEDFLDFGEIAINYADKKIYFKDLNENISLFETPDISVDPNPSTIVRRDSNGKGLFSGFDFIADSDEPLIVAYNAGDGDSSTAASLLGANSPGALISSENGEYHVQFGNSSAIDRVRGSYTFFYDDYFGKIKSANITADRDWTFPDKSGTVAMTSDLETGIVNIGTVGASHTIDLAGGTFQTATLTASTATTFTMPTAAVAQTFTLQLKQAAITGNGSATFTGVKWPPSGAPTITTTAGRMDILNFVSDGINWYGSIVQGYTP